MSKFTKHLYLFFYFNISLVFMELILRSTTSGDVFSMGFIISCLFSIPVSLVFFQLCNFFKDKFILFFSTLLLAISGFIYSTQLIYFNIFRTYYNIYSAGNAGQAVVFWRDALDVSLSNIHWIFLLLLPALLAIFVSKKYKIFVKVKGYTLGLLSFYLVFYIILFQLGGIGVVYLSGHGTNSAYDLYFKNSNPLVSVQKLGLITSMRIDFQRTVTGWSPVLDVYMPEPEPISPDGDETEIGYNVLDIDFDKLILGEEEDTIRKMHEYFKHVQPSAKNDYTGKFEGYNLILLTAESFAPYAVHKEITPTLYKMVHQGYNFTNFYVPLWDVSTTDGEYVALTGLIPKSGVWSFYHSRNNNLPFVMGKQFRDLGYKTVAYHNHTYNYYRRDLSHPNMGYEYKGIGNGLDVKKVWPASDLEMMEKTVSEYINNEPFHAYYMTVSGHLQYNFYGNSMANKNRHFVNDLPYSTQAQAYLATQIELDRALEYLLAKLDEAGIADKTLIALSSDHYPYGLDDEVIDELSGYEIEKHFDLYKSTFIVYTKGMEPKTISTPSSSLDIVPTLSNLLGLEYDSRLLMGRDIFSDSDPLVIFRDHSFITDKGRYNAITGEFIPNTGMNVNKDYIDKISRIVNNKFYFSTQILDHDYYGKVLEGF
ncbi:sulfatase-like hydrolase/transferase [Alkalicella caledoniensis]|uniref:Sulfatase-like hydrolase/transferase n=1 Tax=Alkalicella caledoniensis TaxID=2731377 RepID=A0A7G9W7K0_ALKCA|nr:alkaline phosphatase family protein [Alkalicella caledoniensis]QNO14662.1 sulfatase-like hydrolase/transferase [Alkalicella caledoniensis]